MAVWLARPPASVAKAWTVLRIEGGGFAGRQVVGQDDRPASLRCCELLAALAEQVAEDAFLDVEQVGDAGGEIAVARGSPGPWRSGA